MVPDLISPLWAIIVAAMVGIGVPVLVPAFVGIIAGNMIRGSDWFPGLGVGFLAGLAATGLWILLLWYGYKLFDLTGLKIIGIYIGVSTVVCSAATIVILWMIRDRQQSQS